MRFAAAWTEKEDVSRGENGREYTLYTRASARADGRKRERENDAGMCDATRPRERDDAFLFHRAVETRACHGGGVGGCGGCAREGEDEKRG